MAGGTVGPTREAPTLSLPDHTQLPDHDETIVQNFQEHPQSLLLTDSLGPVVKRLHPDGRYAIGQDCGIYWKDRPTSRTRGRVSGLVLRPRRPADPRRPDEAVLRYVERIRAAPDRPRIRLGQRVRGTRSDADVGQVLGLRAGHLARLLWDLRGRSRQDRDVPLRHDHFEPLPPNDRGHFPINGLGVELGIWRGLYQNLDLPWMRWWDNKRNLLPTGFELADLEAKRAKIEAERADLEAKRAEIEAERASRESDRANRESDRAERLAVKLRALGVEPEA